MKPSSPRLRSYVLFAAFLGCTGIAAGFLLNGGSIRMASFQLQTSAGKAASPSFKTKSTVGQAAAGVAASPNFRMRLGQGRGRNLPGVSIRRPIDPNEDTRLTFLLPSGPATILIPARSFPAPVIIDLRIPVSLAETASNVGVLKGTPIGLEITADQGQQPQKPVTMTFSYRDEDVAGLDESRLKVAFFLETDGQWTPLNSTVDRTQKRVTVQTTHFTIFRVVEWAPSAGLGDAYIYPNPLRPALGHKAMNITNLPADISVKIFTLTGELVTQLTTDATGRALWNGTNGGGDQVASGVYLALLQADGQKKIVKLAVER